MLHKHKQPFVHYGASYMRATSTVKTLSFWTVHPDKQCLFVYISTPVISSYWYFKKNILGLEKLPLHTISLRWTLTLRYWQFTVFVVLYLTKLQRRHAKSKKGSSLFRESPPNNLASWRLHTPSRAGLSSIWSSKIRKWAQRSSRK